MSSADPTWDGALDSLQKWAGFGRATYSDGVVYEGYTRDGEFDGEGKLILPNGGGTYQAVWSRGKEVAGTGALVFDDGLVFNPTQVGTGLSVGEPAAMGPELFFSVEHYKPEEAHAVVNSVDRRAPIAAAEAAAGPRLTRAWDYLAGFDRRLWPEHVSGRRAAIQFKKTPQKSQAGDALVPADEEVGAADS